MNSKLQTSVLLLNQSMIALGVINAKRTFCLLYRHSAEIIDVHDRSFQFYTIDNWSDISRYRKEKGIIDDKFQYIETANQVFLIPKVVRLVNYNDFSFDVVLNRRNIYARDNNECQYCGQHFPTHELSIDHVLPVSKGGRTKWDNVVCSCVLCNNRKGGKTPKQANMRLIKEPHVPRKDPRIRTKLRQEQYKCWKLFLDEAYWNVELED